MDQDESIYTDKGHLGGTTVDCGTGDVGQKKPQNLGKLTKKVSPCFVHSPLPPPKTSSEIHCST